MVLVNLGQPDTKSDRPGHANRPEMHLATHAPLSLIQISHIAPVCP
jgi:hypothetical protein